jgi:hypothetical protein
MQPWTNLARLALIGTEHQPPEQVIFGDAALDDVLGKLGPVEEREGYLLKTGAVLTLTLRAGYKPSDKAITVAPAALETEPRCPDLAGQYLARMLRGYFPQVLPEWLELAGTLGFRVPEELLPELLDHVKGKSHLHTQVATVMGQRGAWLAAQNPDWSFAIRAEGDEKIWQEGKRVERIAALREIRRANPARARELLSGTWKDEAPEDRAEFILVLQAGLSLEDEAFLENALDDKRKEVRVNAVRLLRYLPGSKLVQRLTELATPLLRAKKQLLRGVALEIALPTECTKEMSRYGIGSSASPAKDMGEKAWWLKEMLESIPPAYWLQSLGVSAKELIQAAIKSEWAKALLSGWADALGKHQDRTWVEAWMEASLGREELLDSLPRSAVNQYPKPELEALLTKLLLKSKNLFGDERVISFITMVPSPWGETFSKRVLTEAQEDVNRHAADYATRIRWQNLLKGVALSVPPQLAQATSGWPKEIESNNVREPVDEFCAVIEFRRSIHRHFKGEK